MSHYNKDKKRTIFNTDSKEPFKISRSKIDLFTECPRCFYLDQVLGVPRPRPFPFTLNAAVDKLLKKEFDIHRAAGSPHPMMEQYGIDAVPFAHDNLEEWRDALRKGISYLDPETNLLVRGGIDDVWITSDKELLIVDYKATAKEAEVTLDAEWQDGYKRQVEVYQWLFRQNGFKVSDTAWFVYVNGKTDRKAFDGKLDFDIKLISHKGSDKWIPATLKEIKKCLISEKSPAPAEDCEYCSYRNQAAAAFQARISANKELKESTLF
ncbi:MAG TPA: PD-(D/E)XK nuclease family protein [Candidatus Paceibacterota bacterium]|nr:PD-(D/E)XK nuclease family protein [Candidatus Paceibacterota bacterium]